MKVHPPTIEQTSVLNAVANGEPAVLQAGAGCGKSSTLNMVAEALYAKNPKIKILYVAYNKAIKLDAEANFPKYVTCKTGHALGYDRTYAARLNDPKQTAAEASKAIGAPKIVGWNTVLTNDMDNEVTIPARTFMRLALETVSRFCHSSQTEIQEWHVPAMDNFTTARNEIIKRVFPLAKLAWEDLKQERGVLKANPDHMLKLWALNTHAKLKYDVILLDEAQDLNDVITIKVMDQNHAQIIVVGDSAQQIYEWRGANDALVKFEKHFDLQPLTLSQSFRFGPAIADRANLWLDLIDAPLRLKGLETMDSKVESLLDCDAILSRTNAGVIASVLEGIEAGVKVALVGGSDELKRLCWAAADLIAGKTPDHPDFSGFGSWDELKEYAKDEDKSLEVLIKLVEDHKPEGLLKAISQLVKEEDADLIVSTIHKAKGREWKRVRIVHFKGPKPNADGEYMISKETARLAYVAVTRAREVLDDGELSWLEDVTGVY